MRLPLRCMRVPLRAIRPTLSSAQRSGNGIPSPLYSVQSTLHGLQSALRAIHGPLRGRQTSWASRQTPLHNRQRARISAPRPAQGSPSTARGPQPPVRTRRRGDPKAKPSMPTRGPAWTLRRIRLPLRSSQNPDWMSSQLPGTLWVMLRLPRCRDRRGFPASQELRGDANDWDNVMVKLPFSLDRNFGNPRPHKFIGPAWS
jgi:hypothetical protein